VNSTNILKTKKSNLLFYGLVGAALITSIFLVVNQNSSPGEEHIRNNSPMDTLAGKRVKPDSLKTPTSKKETVQQEDQPKEIKTPDAPINIKLISEGYFQSPLDEPLSASGSFGELRSNHFHAGIDLRTGGVEGKNVYAAADGYVSRIVVSTGGYGKALYISHPNGTQTVYGHLQKFTGAIQDFVVKKQYAQKSFEIELFPSAGSLRVKKGQIVAKSGNTGGSGGPHLHFEIRYKNGEPHNPFLFGLDIKDTYKPIIRSCVVYAIDNEYRKKNGYFPYLPWKGSTMDLPVGRYAVGAEMRDYFTDQMNTMGINYTWLTANGITIYQKEIEHFPFSVGRQINNHIDFYQYKKTKRRYIKLFKDEGNSLPFYRLVKNGYIDLKHGDTVNLILHALDFSGKESQKALVLVGNKDRVWTKTDNPLEGGAGQVITSKGGSISGKGYSISIPRGGLPYSVALRVFSKGERPNMCSPLIQFHQDIVPLMKRTSIRIDYDAQYEKLKEKLVLMEYDPAKKKSFYVGGQLSGNSLVAGVKNLGLYYVSIDTVAPKISSVQNSGRTLSVTVDDLVSGVKTYNTYVDNQWILMEYDPKKKLMVGRIPDSIPPGKHTLKFVVSDGRENTSEVKKTINI
jgi:murein DD-endopeptidase MepM/ murein hydrolase activator NlpD